MGPRCSLVLCGRLCEAGGGLSHHLPGYASRSPSRRGEAMLGRQLPDTARQVEGGHTSSQTVQGPGTGSDFPPNMEDVGLGQRETGCTK